MKNYKKHICECSCGDPEHLLIFHYCEKDNIIDVYFTSLWRDSFWFRIKSVFKYLFRKEQFHISDSVIFTNDNITQLEEFINILKKIKNAKDKEKINFLDSKEYYRLESFKAGIKSDFLKGQNE
jgi:hypothetical protein